ncbi:hypothetical protein Fot_37468 [Forsythia ovata]|uniref:Uncharacterized protein n=1 Tax=Forsythia ovata TaxID=205694 RepID=A0ABD1RZT6_9LAMI
MVQKQELGAKRAKEEKAKGVGSEIGVSSRSSMGDEEDMEILEESMLTRKAKKPRTASSKSSQNLVADASESVEGDKEMEPKNSEGPDYNQLVHIRKILEGEPSNINPESSTGVKLSTFKALVARSLVLIEEAESSVRDVELNGTSVDTALCNSENIIKDRDHFKEWTNWLHGALNKANKELMPLIDALDKLMKDVEAVESDMVEFSKRCDLANQAQEITAKALAVANVQMDELIDKIS